MNVPRRQLTESEVRDYIQRSQQGPCFVCQIVRGEAEYQHHMIYQDDQALVFLNMHQPLYGYTLVAPRQHHEQVVADFSPEEYLSLQRLIHSVGNAVQRAVPTERLYVPSLGSQQGNRHVHWHIAPLPPGVPYSQQQLWALSHESGTLDLSEDEKATLANRIRRELRNGQRSDQPAIQ